MSVPANKGRMGWAGLGWVGLVPLMEIKFFRCPFGRPAGRSVGRFGALLWAIPWPLIIQMLRIYSYNCALAICRRFPYAFVLFTKNLKGSIKAPRDARAASP